MRGPAIVIAMLALVAGVAGTAVAGQSASVSVSKKKVKKIARKQAVKEIQKLELGRPASSYVDRGDESIDLSATPTEILSTQVTTFAAGRALASATLSLRGDTPAANPDERATCSIRIDGTGGPSIEANAPPTSPRRFVISASFARQLDPGTHDVALVCARVAGDVQARQGTLMAWTG